MLHRWWGVEGRERLLLALLTLLVGLTHIVGISLTTGIGGPLVQGDARAYFSYLPSIVLDGDLDLRNQFTVLRPEEGDPRYPYGEGRNGLAANPFPIAPALLWLPGYLFGLGVDRVLAAVGLATQPSGLGVGAVWGAVLCSIMLAGVGAELTRRLARDCVGHDGALPAAVLVWLGTPALYYTLISPLYSHAVAWFAAALMLWLTWQAAQTPHQATAWIWAGLAAGYAVGIRLMDTPLLIVPVTVLAVSGWQSRRWGYLVGPPLAWAVGAGLGYLPQGLTWYWLHGDWLPLQTMDLQSRLDSSPFLGNLFSVGFEGWISWTPMVVPAVLGLLLLATRSEAKALRLLVYGALAGMLGMVLLDAVHPYGAAGAAYGGRRFVSTSPLLALGLAALLTGSAVRRSAQRTAWVVVAALAVWNVWLLTSYELLVNRHDIYPTLLQTARHAVGLGPP